jgi:hypothetical protein
VLERQFRDQRPLAGEYGTFLGKRNHLCQQRRQRRDLRRKTSIG